MSFDRRKLLASPQAIKSLIRSLEDWWFDTTRSVQTSGDAPAPTQSQVVGELSDSLTYAPVRVKNAHQALRDLPIDNFADYTFLDMGSGKGRMLFVAAEYPFKKVRGVEFSRDLHEMAGINIPRYRHRRQRCTDIQSIQANAAEFAFPNENLVLYIFNPFGPEVMSQMLTNLEQSIARYPRHVVVLLLWPELSNLVGQMPGIHLYKQTRRHHIYQTTNPPLPDLANAAR
jgi:SAM-dependent methyltransferase